MQPLTSWKAAKEFLEFPDKNAPDATREYSTANVAFAYCIPLPFHLITNDVTLRAQHWVNSLALVDSLRISSVRISSSRSSYVFAYAYKSAPRFTSRTSSDQLHYNPSNSSAKSYSISQQCFTTLPLSSLSSSRRLLLLFHRETRILLPYRRHRPCAPRTITRSTTRAARSMA